ncbi:uncharacterized protein LOC130052840 isoform X2 [Ostrea edulis]|uniref:uncharacterized protein LOC130052840 isoform X2 n=1 Tax=Ostrea edulis TaxID=37623 RepID=UPI0024AED7A5|nr:uncharacterized protein LOC130052840 isoform X2 [Ostrea edulis]
MYASLKISSCTEFLCKWIRRKVTMMSTIITGITKRWLYLTVSILILSVKKVNVYEDSSMCLTDVERVPSCWKTEEEWLIASERKNCSTVIPKCTHTGTFMYHCLTNAWKNTTYELCGVDTEIIDPKCYETSTTDTTRDATVIKQQSRDVTIVQVITTPGEGVTSTSPLPLVLMFLLMLMSIPACIWGIHMFNKRWMQKRDNRKTTEEIPMVA